MSPIGPEPTQTPEKSGVPSGKRGGGPSGTAPISAGLLAPPLPAGDVPSDRRVLARARPARSRARPTPRDELQSAHELSDRPAAERANTRVPSANVTRRAFAMLAPLRAIDPSTVTSSPCFQRRARPAGAFQVVRARDLEVPVDDLAVGIGHVDVETRVRIRPLDLRDRCLSASRACSRRTARRTSDERSPAQSQQRHDQRGENTPNDLHRRSPSHE